MKVAQEWIIRVYEPLWINQRQFISYRDIWKTKCTQHLQSMQLAFYRGIQILWSQGFINLNYYFLLNIHFGASFLTIKCYGVAMYFHPGLHILIYNWILRRIKQTDSKYFNSLECYSIFKIGIPFWGSYCIGKWRSNDRLGPDNWACRQLGSRQLGPRILDPDNWACRQLGPRQLGPQTIGPTTIGPTDNWAHRQLGPQQLGPQIIEPEKNWDNRHNKNLT